MDPVPDPQLLRKSGSAGDRTRDLCICSQKLWPLDHRGGLGSCIVKLKNDWKFWSTHWALSVMKATVHVHATCTNEQNNFLRFCPQPYPGRALCSSSGGSRLHAHPPGPGSNACRTPPGRQHSIRALRPCSEWTPVITQFALTGR